MVVMKLEFYWKGFRESFYTRSGAQYLNFNAEEDTNDGTFACVVACSGVYVVLSRFYM